MNKDKVRYLCKITPESNFIFIHIDVCNSDNYRGIALTSCVNKVLDWIILLKYVKSQNQQFAVHLQRAPFHSYVHSSVERSGEVLYLTKRRVYCCLLDATKAFDRVHFDKLFEILISTKYACLYYSNSH